MENEFSLVSSERKSLGKGTRLYSSIYGVIVIIFCVINYQLQWLPLIVVGSLSVIYGIVGTELFKTRNSIKITKSALFIKGSFQRKVSIDVKDIKHITLDLYELQVDFINYVKTFNLSWLSGEEHQKLKEKLNELN